MILLPFLIKLITTIQPMPTNETSCDYNEIYQNFHYACEPCPTGTYAQNGFCFHSNASFFLDENGTEISECNILNNTILHDVYCFSNFFQSIYSNYEHYQNNFTLYDFISSDKSKKSSSEILHFTESFHQNIVFAYYSYSYLLQNQSITNKDYYSSWPLEFLANACTLTHFSPQSDVCSLFTSNSGTLYDYSFWPLSIPFLSYGKTTTVSSILSEKIITRSFNINDIINIHLAMYNRNGTFIGFKVLQTELQSCPGEHNILQTWRHFGSNYYQECKLDITDFLETLSDSLSNSGREKADFFEPFIEDVDNSTGKLALRPLPVLDLSFVNSDNMTANRDDDEMNHRAFRRFFILDDYSVDNVIQYADSISLHFQVQDEDLSKLKPPILEVSYKQIHINIDKKLNQINTSNEFLLSFNVDYKQSLSSFWMAVLVAFSVFCALALVFWLLKIFILFRTDGEDGMTMKLLMEIIAAFFEIFGFAFFFVVFIFCGYILIVFKGQKTTHFLIPDNDQLYLLIPFMWTSFSCLLIASILKIFIQIKCELLIIDWENSEDKQIKLMSWRRWIIANEWNQLFTFRDYNIPFSLISLIFILRGFHLDYLSNPIPNCTLQQSKYYSNAIQFAFITFLWICIFLIQYLFFNCILCFIYSSPFKNLLNLCSSSNISLFIRTSTFHGYYIHGFCPNKNSDISIGRPQLNYISDSSNTIQKRGLEPDSDKQVFETFLSADFRMELQKTSNNTEAKVGGPPLLSTKQFMTSNVPFTQYDQYYDMNELLKNFFRLSSDSKKYNYKIQQSSFVQTFLHLAPTVLDESILAHVPEKSFKKSMLSGIEYLLSLTYLLFFLCITLHTNSPSSAAFAIFLVDVIVVIIFKFAGKSILSKKMFLDDRFQN